MAEQQRVVRIQTHGGPEILELVQTEVGAPAAGEVRVRHRAIGLNFIDIYQRSGLYPLPLPHVLGMEGAGYVEAVGAEVDHLQVGDRVAYASQPPGSYADVRVLPARCVVKLPEAIDFETGAAMMLKGMTAQYLLRRTLPQGGLQAGDFIVFHAAAGGVGLIACQWARALGYRVIGTAGTDEKCALAHQQGAEFTINYRRENIVERVRKLTQGQGVKVVYDSIGRDTFEASLDCLAPLGLMVSYGNASGPVPPVQLGLLMAKGSLHLTRPGLFTHLATRQATQSMADELFAQVLQGHIRIPLERRYPLTEVAQAHRDLEARLTTGCSVLVP